VDGVEATEISRLLPQEAPPDQGPDPGTFSLADFNEGASPPDHPGRELKVRLCGEEKRQANTFLFVPFLLVFCVLILMIPK
jgi:hypothetical protein